MKNKYTLTHIPICPYCNIIATYKNSKEVFGKDYGMIYLCGLCQSYVGTHKDTGVPLGTMANKELRLLRIKCHELFDPLWKSGKMSRKDAYTFLSLQLGIEFDQCHFGLFREDLCNKTIALLSNDIQ